jgi:hypothetical protein
MSAWLEIPRHRSDGRHRLPNRQLCDRLSKILQKFFLELSCIQTVLPYRPDSRTLAACNFHIKAWRVRTMTSVIQTVNLMHSISYMKLARPDHEDGRSDVCFFNARLALWISTSGRESTSSKLFQLSSHIWGLERNPITDRALSGARTCNWNVQTDSSWSGSKLLDTEEGQDNDALDSWASGWYIMSSERLQGIWFHWHVDCEDYSRRTLNSYIPV